MVALEQQVPFQDHLSLMPEVEAQADTVQGLVVLVVVVDQA
jgi:hypothetical protein|tara:strand:- start:231 stop:353 length:123 start_codon:yes stop_codon:yes gene_type:complete